ncbi:MAG: phosphotransferase [[Clostridium] fimetarium]|nr:phosphotransferase [[Clostridium] fimetarium]
MIADDGTTVIGTEGDDAAENRTFRDLSQHFASKGLPVPSVLAISPDSDCYLQSDLGDKSLFDAIADGRSSGYFSPEETALLSEAVRMLARIQIEGGRDMDFSICSPYEAMDRRMVDWDLNYFKYCFLKPALGEIDDARLQDEFDMIRERLLEGESSWHAFMARDFQSRNIMVTDEGLKLIDFQGGRRGPLAYDLVSLLWQAKAKIPRDIRWSLIDVYINEANALGAGLDPAEFRESVPMFALFRVMQTLGAYGFRGLVQGKQHFIESIPRGVANLVELVAEAPVSLPYLKSVAAALAERFKCEIPAPGLTVTVGSFSYKKGYPADPSGNGGGFVFDCRAIHNPGRYEQYRRLTGMDEPVRRFLEEDGEVLTFLSHAEPLVGASVERYIKRGFTSLSVWFGCTGGQHRSVYCAEAMARFVNGKYGARVRLIHREQGVEKLFEPIER